MSEQNDTSRDRRTKLSRPIVRPPSAGSLPSWEVVVVDGVSVGRHTALGEQPVYVGRRHADLELDDEEISRQHAVFEPLGSAYRVKDLGSTNGTFVNGERVVTSEIREGDLIRIGRTVLAVRRVAEE